MRRFNPAQQSVVAEHLTRCLLETPTLADTAQVYGKHVVKTWLAIQLRDLSEFTGCKDKLTAEQIDNIAAVIRTEFYYLRVAEIMLFMHKFKSGQYGRFYGAVDGLVITTALQDYCEWRNEQMRRIAQQQRAEWERRREAERERLAAEGKLITYAEWRNKGK